MMIDSRWIQVVTQNCEILLIIVLWKSLEPHFIALYFASKEQAFIVIKVVFGQSFSFGTFCFFKLEELS